MTHGARTVVFFEIDQPFCTRTYGEAPCTAKLGVTGTDKCYNTLATCQDEENFEAGTLTLRFARDDDRLALEYGPVLACLDKVTTKPGRINLAGMDDGAAFGMRETVTVNLRDFKWSDHLVDKYRLERTFVPGAMLAGFAMPRQAYPTFGVRRSALPELEAIALSDFLGYDDPALAPYERGTFWSRFLARNPYYPVMNCRVRVGEAGQALEDMRVWHYVIERIEGPNDGEVRVYATDLFSRIEARKALAPFPSIGDLVGGISGTPATFGVSTGTGSLTPAEGGYSTITGAVEGYVAIGRKEIIKVTRSGDTFTVVQRGALGTVQEDHAAGDTVQLVLGYVGELSHDIAYDLITGYTEVPASAIDKPTWDALAAVIPEQFTGYIAEPTPVQDLLGELEVQAGFTLWPEVSTGMIRYAPLRSGSVSPAVDDRGWIIDGSLQHRRRDDKRISQVLFYYVKRNPLSDLEDPTSYAARVIHPGPGASPYGAENVRNVFSRWVTTGGQATARKAARRIYAMYADTPIEAKFSYDASRAGELEEARYFSLETAEIQNALGDVRPIAMAPVSIKRGENVEEVQALSVRFSEAAESGVRQINIDTDELNINLRTLHDLQYAAPTGSEVIEFIVAAGATIGSTSTGSPAVRTGVWPAGVTLKLVIKGRIQGAGGAGGAGGSGAVFSASTGADGQPGGTALEALVQISVDNTDGELWGGGGGAGGGGATHGSYKIFLDQPFACGGGAGGGGTGTIGGGSAPGGNGVSENGGSIANVGSTGSTGTANAGGAGGAGGAYLQTNGGAGGTGGGPGLAGAAGFVGHTDPGNCEPTCGAAAGGNGGAAGNYIVGNTLVNWIAVGDVRGGVG